MRQPIAVDAETGYPADTGCDVAPSCLPVRCLSASTTIRFGTGTFGGASGMGQSRPGCRSCRIDWGTQHG